MRLKVGASLAPERFLELSFAKRFLDFEVFSHFCGT